MRDNEENKLFIREMRVCDAYEVGVLCNKLGIDQLSQNVFYPKPIDTSDLTEHYESYIEDGEVQVFVADSGGKIVGFVEVWHRDQDDSFEIAPFAYILNLFVKESVRKEKIAYGVFFGLFEAASDWAIKKGYGFLGADTYHFNGRVQKFLNSVGFSRYKIKFIKKLKSDEETSV
ncbi:acetyltransferase [Clostridia bacterium]|nr:acetyltransferase [Clostridia bacterium]